jgi:hypothetical protein
MKRNHFAEFCAVVALSATGTNSFAQSTSDHEQTTAAQSTGPESASTTSSLRSDNLGTGEKSREDVMRELRDFQANGGAAKIQEIYRGGS